MVGDDVQVLGAIAIILILLCFLFFKELKLLCFDANFGRSLGFPMAKLDFLLMLFLVVAVVIGLQAAGVVLMAALLITPAAAARYWTERLDRMVILSACMGAISGVLGTFISSIGYNLSTGPIIVIAATVMFLFSMFFAPKRGLLAKWLRFIKTRQQVAREHLLEQMFNHLEKEMTDTVLLHQLEQQGRLSKRALKGLERSKLITIEQNSDKQLLIRFTKPGWKVAYETVLNKRMLEMWLMHENDLEGEKPHHDWDLNEQIPERLVPQLRQLLIRHQREPKLQPLTTSVNERVSSS
jgi:manganese/zinc/iron transport system permease protein